MTDNSKKAAKTKLTVKNGKVYGDALSAEEKKSIVAEKKKGKRGKRPQSAQQSIPYVEMCRDGTCKVNSRLYTKTIRFDDINYQLAGNEDKTAIFENWCDFLNFFDSSISVQLSFINQQAGIGEFQKSIQIPAQDDAFNDIRAEYSGMLQDQLAKGNNGLVKRKYIMEKWLEVIKSSVAVPTFASYSTSVKKIIAPYFREKEITLKNLTAKDIQEFYLKELERVSASSVIHYHANIHKALKYAVKIDLIDSNPADKVERPKKDRFIGSFYDADEVNALLQASKGTKLEMPILFGSFYGLRRSEVIGLKWDAIDFEHDTITIRHTVTSCDIDGKRVLVAADTTKTKSSLRTLPLVPFVRERLLALKEEQKENRRLCGRSYNREYLDYVCVNEIGDLIKPHYVTESFSKLLKASGMRQIRFHDLRHSCASLLLANGVPMKQIQEWLGHSDFSTTANIYAHLEYSSKLSSADAMLSGLGLVSQ